MIFLTALISCKTLDGNAPSGQSASQNNENEDFSIDLPENYFLEKNQGKDGVIYYFESNINGVERRHGEIFLGFHPGEAENYYANKVETFPANILGEEVDIGIYFENETYSAIAIIPLDGEGMPGRYIRIIGTEPGKEELYKLINSFSTIKLK
jgi:hypothetical protein